MFDSKNSYVLLDPLPAPAARAGVIDGTAHYHGDPVVYGSLVHLCKPRAVAGRCNCSPTSPHEPQPTAPCTLPTNVLRNLLPSHSMNPKGTTYFTAPTCSGCRSLHISCLCQRCLFTFNFSILDTFA